MIIPARMPFEDLVNEVSEGMLQFFVLMINTKMVDTDLNFDATLQVLRDLYNTGHIKFSLEPSASPEEKPFRLLLYDAVRDSYRIITKVRLREENGKICFEAKLPNAVTGL